MPTKIPEVLYRPHARLLGNLGVGAVLTNTQTVGQKITVANARAIIVRIKTVTSTGTLAWTWAGPDTDVGTPTSAPTTLYTTNNPAGVAVVAATEAVLIITSYPMWNGTIVVPAGYNGESYGWLTFACTATGSVSYCDVAQISQAT